MRLKGKVIKWQNDKGFGFIEPIEGMPDLFFHENFLLNQSRRPVFGDDVSFEITTNPEEKLRAERILFRGERGAEPIPAISRSKKVTLVKITLFHSKVQKAIICFFSIDYSRIHVF